MNSWNKSSLTLRDSRNKQKIKQRKVNKFANDAIKVNIKSKDVKITEIKCTRDLLGRLLYIAVRQKKWYWDHTGLSIYPNTTVSVSYRWHDEQNIKSVLMKNIKFKHKGRSVALPDVYLVDLMIFLTLSSAPQTFRGIANMILSTVCNLAPLVHVVCDY